MQRNSVKREKVSVTFFIVWKTKDCIVQILYASYCSKTNVILIGNRAYLVSDNTMY